MSVIIFFLRLYWFFRLLRGVISVLPSFVNNVAKKHDFFVKHKWKITNIKMEIVDK